MASENLTRTFLAKPYILSEPGVTKILVIAFFILHGNTEETFKQEAFGELSFPDLWLGDHGDIHHMINCLFSYIYCTKETDLMKGEHAQCAGVIAHSAYSIIHGIDSPDRKFAVRLSVEDHDSRSHITI